ncbi:hypothetical protein PC116_g5466 [Phytophthora cactorum]|nr:hypothetical protein PC116_g5466 [Phytophthora cactorum]
MGGRTAHSTFKIPLKLNDTSTCSIYKQSHLKGLIQKASLVIRDEAPMTHRHAFEAVDWSLRDLMVNDDEPFGGKVFVLSGDFRQILPVVVRGTPVQTLNACLKSSTLWPQFQQLHLRENMKVMSAPNESTATELAEFLEFLLQVGEGRHEIRLALGQDCIKIPKDMLIKNRWRRCPRIMKTKTYVLGPSREVLRGWLMRCTRISTTPKSRTTSISLTGPS